MKPSDNLCAGYCVGTDLESGGEQVQPHQCHHSWIVDSLVGVSAWQSSSECPSVLALFIKPSHNFTTLSILVDEGINGRQNHHVRLIVIDTFWDQSIRCLCRKAGSGCIQNRKRHSLATLARLDSSRTKFRRCKVSLGNTSENADALCLSNTSLLLQHLAPFWGVSLPGATSTFHPLS